MNGFPLLSMVTFLPLVGVLFLMPIRGDQAVVNRNAKYVALWTSVITFVLSLFVLVNFDPANPDFQMVERFEWLTGTGIYYQRGVDGISLWFILGSTLLTPICVLAAWEAVETRVKEFMIALLVLETMMIGMFTATDLILAYIFFEGVLLPMFIMIGVWGGPRRIYAAYKFFLYTLVGSVLMLLAMMTIYVWSGIDPATGAFSVAQATTRMDIIIDDVRIPFSIQVWLWLAFLASFAVKSPMWPVHTWLPDAHVEAPTVGSVMLAGILLKMGGYGLIRFSVQMLPEATAYFAPLIYTLSVIAIIYTSLVALAQSDIKKLIAYSSVAHMGFVTLGIFTMTMQGMDGAMFQMLSHTVVSAALFLCVGVIYDRLHTREIDRYGGLAQNMPAYALVFMVFTMASVGLPGTSGFVGEFLTIVGTFQVSTTTALFATLGIVLGATYMLSLYRRVFFGKLEKDDVKRMPDLTFRERMVFAPLVTLVLWMGVYPATFQSRYQATVAKIIEQHEERVTAAGIRPLGGILVAER